MKASSDLYTLNAYGVRVAPTSSTDFSYSDGSSVEQYIETTLASVHDLSISSPELRSSIKCWASEYHFSQERHNLLRNVTFTSGMNILELGAGCGAITRQLGETGARVVSVEGSYRRACAAAARTRDLKNVEIYCSNFQHIDFAEKFDIVTLIGVLEYSPQFFNSADPVRECLALAASSLKSDGVLIIAIENQLGLKYFAGLREDHVDVPYFGIEDRYHDSTAITFGRLDLTNRLHEAGLHATVFNYPFPDYKIPSAVFTEHAFTAQGFCPEEIIRQCTSRDYSGDLGPAFNEHLAVPVLCRNGLMRDMSNSFLVFAAKDENSISWLYDQRLLAAVYTTERKNAYNVQTLFLHNGTGIVTEKDLLFKSCAPQPARGVLEHLVPLREAYVAGLNVGAECKKLAALKDYDAIYALFDLQLAFFLSDAVVQPHSALSSALQVKGEYFDCIPSNLILRDGNLHYVDREWRCLEPFTLATLVLRTVDALHSIDASAPELSKETLLSRLARLGLAITPAMLADYNALIRAVLDQVYPPPPAGS